MEVSGQPHATAALLSAEGYSVDRRLDVSHSQCGRDGGENNANRGRSWSSGL
jgi:hypothetical protein